MFFAGAGYWPVFGSLLPKAERKDDHDRYWNRREQQAFYVRQIAYPQGEQPNKCRTAARMAAARTCGRSGNAVRSDTLVLAFAFGLWGPATEAVQTGSPSLTEGEGWGPGTGPFLGEV